MFEFTAAAGVPGSAQTEAKVAMERSATMPANRAFPDRAAGRVGNWANGSAKSRPDLYGCRIKAL